nr:ribonuclease H-like domain-containing protein [Tanacetum cinerariifolium]
MPTTRSGMTQEAIDELIAKRVVEALEAYDVARNPRPLEESEDEQEDDNGTIMEMEVEMDLLKCQPLNFKVTEGVVGLTRWFIKMETVFHISNCLQKYQMKYASCTLYNSTLTWWNSHKRTVGTNSTYAMTWKALMKLMYENNIQGNVTAAEVIRLQDVIRFENNLMDHKLKGYVARNAENKMRFDNNPREKYVQQPPFKRQNVGGQNMARAYTVGNGKKKGLSVRKQEDPLRVSMFFWVKLWFHGKVKKQAAISKFSSEAEYRSMSSTSCGVVWLGNLLHDISLKDLYPVELFCDNSSSIQIIANPVFHESTKHFELDVHFVREMVLAGGLVDKDSGRKRSVSERKKKCQVISLREDVKIEVEQDPPGGECSLSFVLFGYNSFEE